MRVIHLVLIAVALTAAVTAQSPAADDSSWATCAANCTPTNPAARVMADRLNRSPYTDLLVKNPLALGIHFGHDASVAICSPQGILFAVQEERVSRIKHHFGFPRQSIEVALAHCGVSAQDIGIVAFSTSQAMFPERRNAWDWNRVNDSKVLRPSKGSAHILSKRAPAKYTGMAAWVLGLWSQLVWAFA